MKIRYVQVSRKLGGSLSILFFAIDETKPESVLKNPRWPQPDLSIWSGPGVHGSLESNVDTELSSRVEVQHLGD